MHTYAYFNYNKYYIKCCYSNRLKCHTQLVIKQEKIDERDFLENNTF